ncbi:hypothetical protein [Lysobacter gummosus]|uniref:hypothetical protein n=1 Tax=Lysobacter gummosus TaxID=262324 RepID=UPI0036270CF4
MIDDRGDKPGSFLMRTGSQRRRRPRATRSRCSARKRDQSHIFRPAMHRHSAYFGHDSCNSDHCGPSELLTSRVTESGRRHRRGTR